MGFAKAEGDGAGESGGGKVKRDPDAEPDSATGHPVGASDADDSGSEPGTGAGAGADDPPTVDGEQESAPAEPPVTVDPPAMTPLEVAQAGPAAAVRVHCDASCGQEWCLYAGSEFPADEHGEPYGDPREVVMAAAGCRDDPPTCPGATDATRPGPPASATASPAATVATVTPEARAAMLAAASTPDLVAAGVAHVVRGPMSLPGRMAALAGDGATELVGAQPLHAPIMLTTAEAHGIADGQAPATLPYATGAGGVLDVLRALNVDPGPLEAVLVEATPEPDETPDDEPDGSGDAIDDHNA